MRLTFNKLSNIKSNEKRAVRKDAVKARGARKDTTIGSTTLPSSRKYNMFIFFIRILIIHEAIYS